MSQNAVRFLIELSQDPARMEDYRQDPGLVLGAAGLTVEEREVIRSGDAARLQALLGRSVPLLMSQRPVPPPPPPPPPKPVRAPKPKPARKPTRKPARKPRKAEAA